MKYFNSYEDFNSYTGGTLKSGEVYLVKLSETAYEIKFRTNNINGTDEVYSAGIDLDKVVMQNTAVQGTSYTNNDTVYVVKLGGDELETITLPNCEIVTGSAMKANMNLKTVNLAKCKEIGEGAFQACLNLITVNIPNCEKIEAGGFGTCQSLETIDLPKCTSIGDNAFNGCTYLQWVDLPVVETLGTGAFVDCESLFNVELPKCTSIGDDAFVDCESLANVDLPKCTSIGDNAFNGCTCLQCVDPPVVETLGTGAFVDCESLINVELPKCTSIGDNAFKGCTYLLRVVAPVCTSVGANAFDDCESLQTLVLPEDASVEATLPDGVTQMTPEEYDESLNNPSEPGGGTDPEPEHDVFDIYLSETNGMFKQNPETSRAVFQIKDSTGSVLAQKILEPTYVTESEWEELSYLEDWTFQIGSKTYMMKIGNGYDDNGFVDCIEYGPFYIPSSYNGHDISILVGEVDADNYIIRQETISGSGLDVEYGHYNHPTWTGFATLVMGVLTDNRTEIPDEAYNNRSYFSNVVLPNATSIGVSAFSGSSVTAVSLPACTSLGEGAFCWCNSLIQVTLGEGLSNALEKDPIFYFGNTSGIYNEGFKVVVPETSYGDYISNEYWNEILDKIEIPGGGVPVGYATSKVYSDWQEDWDLDENDAEPTYVFGVFYDGVLDSCIVCPPVSPSELELYEGTLSIEGSTYDYQIYNDNELYCVGVAKFEFPNDDSYDIRYFKTYEYCEDMETSNELVWTTLTDTDFGSVIYKA